MIYRNVFVAGTFDGLHAGHQFLLSEAFRVGEKVTVGLTSNSFISKYKSKFLISKSKTNPKFQIQKKIKSYIVRKSKIEAWLRKQGFFERVTMIPINDPYEPAASMQDLDALIVTAENRKTGERINVLRQSSALPSLTLIEVPMVAAQDGKPVSSTRMRNGEIDAAGRLIMPESLRTILAQPLGNVLTGERIALSIRRSTDIVVITVGDIATKTLLDAGITPSLVIVDGKVGRKPFHETVDRLQPRRVSPFEAKTVKSGPGFISKKAIQAIQNCFPHPPIHPSTHHAIVIDGEEDLLALPAIIYAPLGSVLFYGQPGEGIVFVRISKRIQNRAHTLLKKFLVVK